MDIFAELQRLGSLIRQLQGALNGKTIRDGTDTVTFSAASNSGAKTITHGLPGAPTSVQVTGYSGVNGIFYECDNITSTTFDVVGWHPAGSISATHSFTWLAAG